MDFQPRFLRCNLKFHVQWISRLTSILVLALAASGAAAQGSPLVGPYGFVLNGTYSDASAQGGVAVLGLMDFDGAGGITGSYTFEIGSGGMNQEGSVTGSLTGSYSTNPDGTGTLSVALDMGLDATLAMVTNNRGRSLQLAATSCSGSYCDLSETVVSGVAEAEFNGPPHTVRKGFLTGSYGLQFTKSAPTPQTTLGVWSFDGAGNVSLSGTFVAPGPSVGKATLQGTYSVNPDGTGTISIPSQNGQPAGQTWVFVIAEGHSGLLVLQTNRAGDGVNYGIGSHQ